MFYLHTNNAASTLLSAISPTSDHISVQNGHGVLFPLPGVDEGFFVTVENRVTGLREIMLCTQRTGDTLTVTRGQQGTVPQSFAAGVSVANRVTAQILNEFVAVIALPVAIDRIPPIPDEKIIGMSSSKLIGEVPLALIPTIPNDKLVTGIDAAKLAAVTGPIPDAAFPNPIPAAKLPDIPSAKLTSVPAGNLTGTIAAARFADNTIAGTRLMSGQDASKITVGTLANARLPTAISVATVTTSGNVAVGGSITADNVTVTGRVNGSLLHLINGGYVEVGVFSAAHGTGYGRFFYNSTSNYFQFQRNIDNALSTINALKYTGSGAELTNIPIAYSDVGAADVGAVAWLLGNGTVVADTEYSGASLRFPYLRVDSSDNSLHMSFSGSGPAGQWRALQSASAAAGERPFAQFVRVS